MTVHSDSRKQGSRPYMNSRRFETLLYLRPDFASFPNEAVIFIDGVIVAKIAYRLRHFDPSVLPSTFISTTPGERIFVIFDIRDLRKYFS